MTISPLKLYHGAIASGAPATVYTVPARLRVVLKRLLVVGVVGTTVTLQINAQPVTYSEAVTANKRLEQLLGTALVAGDTIKAGAGAAGLVLLVEGFSY